MRWTRSSASCPLVRPPAPTPVAARVAALERVAARLQATRARWREVTVRWVANQYMWTFAEGETFAEETSEEAHLEREGASE